MRQGFKKRLSELEDHFKEKLRQAKLIELQISFFGKKFDDMSEEEMRKAQIQVQASIDDYRRRDAGVGL